MYGIPCGRALEKWCSVLPWPDSNWLPSNHHRAWLPVNVPLERVPGLRDSPLHSALLCPGALVGAVAGELLLGWAREEDVETDKDVERQMDRAAERVGAWAGTQDVS